MKRWRRSERDEGRERGRGDGGRWFKERKDGINNKVKILHRIAYES